MIRTQIVVAGGGFNSSSGVADSLVAFEDGAANVSGGTLGTITMQAGTSATISGGRFGRGFLATRAGAGSDLTLVGNSFEVDGVAVIDISGGMIGESFWAYDGSTVNITGGQIGSGFGAFDGAVVNLTGTEFFIDGVKVTFLAPDEASTIVQRDVAFSGMLEDGSPFEFNLDSVFSSSGFIEPGATLIVTLVPSPGDCPEDLDGSGTVDLPDLLVLLANFGQTTAGGDVTGDGEVMLDDLLQLLAAFGANCH